MAILASLTVVNLFSNLPSTASTNEAISSTASSPPPPIPVPKYPPPKPKTPSPTAVPPNPAINTFHRRTKYFKSVKEGVISSDGDRSVVVGDSGISYLLPGAPFEFQYSYSETPKVRPLAIREPAFLPFAPSTMARPWTGKAPLKSSKKKIPLFDSFNPPPPGSKGMKHVQMPGPFPFGKHPKQGKTREEILGEPLKKWEIQMLINPLLSDNRQVNLGRDGLTHNMLELIHFHWKRRRVCKIKCKGVPTVDMTNICRCIEEKAGGKIIYETGGVLYLFRGRNYNYRTRPQYPVMLWKPAAPIYPKLIQDAPEGLTKDEADELRIKGKSLLPICKLAKNGVYITLVSDVRHAFEGSSMVKIDCKGMHATDYKKLGAKLKELVPCVLLSFDEEQILMWKGRDWKSMFPQPTSPSLLPEVAISNGMDEAGRTKEGSWNADVRSIGFPCTSLKMTSLWKRAVLSNRALLLDKALSPNELLDKVEEFGGVSQALDHSRQVQILSSQNSTSCSMAEIEKNHEKGDDWGEEDGIYTYSSDEDGDDGSDPFVEGDSSPIPIGSLPIDRIAKKLSRSWKNCCVKRTSSSNQHIW